MTVIVSRDRRFLALTSNERGNKTSEANTTARLARVAINGFGRIGRTITRIAKLRGHYDVVAVNDLASPEQLADAFKYDNTHGIFPS